MSHAFRSLWVHVTWATKHRHPWISRELKQPLYDFLRQTARDNDIHLDFVNGVADHVHCLLSLKTTDQLDRIRPPLKGRSTRGNQCSAALAGQVHGRSSVRVRTALRCINIACVGYINK